MRAQTAGACVCTNAVKGKREIAGVHEPLTVCVAVLAGKVEDQSSKWRL